ncbi:hypothetical protein CUZ56_00162 [Saezia sanguinis]|uniref:Uncharacterized protein n=1 Tax=Saezia sanguinis TaxID=1965230 RepID=A0A433SG73_9BURK|nr:hypothetical protein CUZ56_00162 [Saezia sanguinis]
MQTGSLLKWMQSAFVLLMLCAAGSWANAQSFGVIRDESSSSSSSSSNRSSSYGNVYTERSYGGSSGSFYVDSDGRFMIQGGTYYPDYGYPGYARPPGYYGPGYHHGRPPHRPPPQSSQPRPRTDFRALPSPHGR